jgi:hypothetical protein
VEEREHKFVRCASTVLGEERAQALWESVREIESIKELSHWPELLIPSPL